MKKTRKRTTLSIEEARHLLGAEAPIPISGYPSDFLSLKALASITKDRLVSRGGRPSDPTWTVSRKVPMKSETWVRLDRYAQKLQEEQDIRISAGQVAAFALERGLEMTIDSGTPVQQFESSERTTVEYEFSSEARSSARQMKQPILLYGLW